MPQRTQVNPLLLAAVLFVAITLPAKADNPIAKELQNKTATEPEYYQVQNEHAAMHQAVIKARKSVGKFIEALKHPAAGQTDFEVKNRSGKCLSPLSGLHVAGCSLPAHSF